MNHVQLVRLGNYICLNDGDGKIETDSIAFSHYPATTITPVDFINDGLIDPAVPHRDNGQRHPGSLDGRTRSRQIPAIEAKMYQEKDHEAEKSLKDLLSLEGFS